MKTRPTRSADRGAAGHGSLTHGLAGNGDAPLQTVELLAAATRAAAEDSIWLEVIHKMDEVYNDLLQYEVSFKEKNAALEDSQQFISSVLTSMSDLLIVCSRAGSIESVNQALASLLVSMRNRCMAGRYLDLRRRRVATKRRASAGRATRPDGLRIANSS